MRSVNRRYVIEFFPVVVGIACFALGFLLIAKVVDISADAMIFVRPALFLGYGLVSLRLARRYLAA